MRLSVIIPTLNEATTLRRAVEDVRARSELPGIEIIVADCGSCDGTPSLARELGARLATGARLDSRARACNAGARLASGDALLFLHADSRPPGGFDRLIAGALGAPGVVGGAFAFQLDGPELRLRVVEAVNCLRYRFLADYYGDQGLFVRRDVFEAAGGFPDRPILEDAAFCRSIARFGALRLLRAKMPTSPRRFRDGGILTTLAFDALIWGWEMLGLDPKVFARRYRRHNALSGRSPDC